MKKQELKHIIDLLKRGELPPPEWRSVLFPNQKRECELVYDGKAREEDIIAETMAVPLQPTRLFGNNGDGWHNQLIFGDNLQIMRSLLEKKNRSELCNADGTSGIRLVYIDPPFSTKREMRGSSGERAYNDKIAGAEFLEFLRKRLIFIRELLSADGSVYAHLDQRMSAYVRVLMDEVFGKENFVNEIIWQYDGPQGPSKIKFSTKHDTIIRYAKSNDVFASVEGLYVEIPIAKENLKKYKKDEQGKWFYDLPPGSYTDESIQRLEKEGRIRYTKSGNVRVKYYLRTNSSGEILRVKSIPDVWADIPSLGNINSKEKTGYPTQKPEALLERIIKASSNEGDLVADFFMGSGTTIAVAEKLGRRWIGADCGKLAIYTTQKRMLNLKKEIGNKGTPLKPKTFAFYNAGLYDLAQLRKQDFFEWRKFAMLLFGCSDNPHIIGGIQMDGRRKGKSVMVHNHHEHKDAEITEETIKEIHSSIGTKVGNQVFIIAPAGSFSFFQDYINLDSTRYYALRIPYSFIYDLHKRDFSALLQPIDEQMVNDTVDAVGFDFMTLPDRKYSAGCKPRTGELIDSAYIKITTFKSNASVRNKHIPNRDNLETLAMLMLDFNYKKPTRKEEPMFQFSKVFLADDLQKDNWTAYFPTTELIGDVMAIFVDIYGNEARELIPLADFGIGNTRKTTQKKTNKKSNKKGT